MRPKPVMVTCPTCNGDRVIACDCLLCRLPEGRAMGVMGFAHRDRDCPACGGAGEVPEGEDFVPTWDGRPAA